MPNGHRDAVGCETDANRFRLVVDAITDYAIYMLDPNGRVASWNAGAVRLKGYTPAEAIGQDYSSFFTPEDRARGLPSQILATVQQNGRYEGEGWRTRKDGTRFFASVVLYRLDDRRGQQIGFAKVTRDITERKAAQDALLESERRFRSLVQGVTDYAIYMLDSNGNVTNWNAGAERIKGYTTEEIVGQHFSRFYTLEDRRAGVPSRSLATATREGRFETEGWHVRKDRSRFWATVVIDAIRSSEGELIGFAKITRDISERRQAQENLEASERQFRLLVNGVIDYALFMLDPNGIVTSWNAGAQRIKGYKADEIIGQHFSRFYTAGDRAAGLPARALQTALTEGRFGAEGWRVRKDGTWFWANVVIDPIIDDDGRLVGYSKITRDITERHEAQKLMEESQLQIAQMQKMEALGQLTGGVAHDFNNLLMVVSGYIPRIKQLLAEDPKGLRAAEAIEVAAERGATLTRQLLSFSRRQALKPAIINLAETLEAVRPILGSVVGGSVDFLTTILPDVWRVLVDLSELELAIINVTVNARDAMSRGGVISVTAENVRLTHGGTPDHLEGEFVALTVADTGHGIPPDLLTKVFDPFFTTKEAGKGTGLGLSQVHGFAHQSGGSVTITSEIGQGTRVTLYLPRAPDGATAEPPVRTESLIGAERKVLLVEDNPEVAAATAELLNRLGCETKIVSDAAVALETLATDHFDILLSDIVMAGAMNGIDLAREVHRQCPDLRIVLATGYSDAEAHAAQEFTVLRKPYAAEDLDWAFALPRQGNVVAFQDRKRDRASKSSC